MKSVCYGIGLMLLCVGCVNVTYVGTSYPPTKKVVIYDNQKDVPKGEYTIMGHAIFSADEGFASSEISDKIKSEAESKGADAVVIVSMKRVMDGSQANYNYPYMMDPDWGWDYDGYWGPPYGVEVAPPPDGATVTYDYEVVVRALFLKKKRTS